jgi:cyclopropane fatty-acyl-phospholipid synthase-like methyltransferase
LPAPAVAPDAYDEAYYLNMCLGYEEWRRSDGAEMAGLYPGVLDRAMLRPGELLVDIGAGRGELVVAAAERGGRAVGVEYSQAAIDLARRTLAAHGEPPGAEVLLADARELPLPDREADLVTMIDVIEHLDSSEQAQVLREAHRVLAPGGRILIHTLPNRLIYDVTYRIQRALTPRRRRAWPRDPRHGFEHELHVGEQSARSLRRSLRSAGFEAVDVRHGEMIYAEFVPDRRARATYYRLAAHRLSAPLGSADLWASARRG